MIEQLLYRLAQIALLIYQPTYVLAIVVGLVFAISGVTDLFFDLYYILRSIYRFIPSRKWPKLTLERLDAREQQKIAIFIACWHEADVIAHTLTNAVETIQYRNYDIFVGTYPNDPETQYEVDKVARKYPHVHKVITPDDGPTNKASNLNHIFHALRDYENRTQQHYEIIMTHDSEDIIHPYSLLVVNYLIPRKDMVQIPVFPLAVPLKNVTHWTYADEFAENHTKLLLVRELTGGFVPSAGVGCAFTRRAFELFAFRDRERIFSPNSLTEDYELGLRMNLEGIRAAFALVNIPSPKKVKTGKRSVADWVATRAIFPMQLKNAVRQKTRWNIGIILQAWENQRWQGNAVVRWNLFQDRKALVTTPVNFLAYFVFIYFLIYQLLQIFYTQYLPPLIIRGSLLWYLVVCATFFMIWRAINRAYAVNKIYGFWPAVTSIPRVVWGNIINFFAVTRAVNQYISSRIKNQPLVWDKTSHQFPTVELVSDGFSVVDYASSQEPIAAKLPLDEMKQKIREAVLNFKREMKSNNLDRNVKAIRAVTRETGPYLYLYLIEQIHHPSWRVRAEVCRTLSFLRYSLAIPHLEKAATDSDWTVRSNAVRALGKLGFLGERALIRVLQGDDRYARDAALAILEHQGFFQQNLQRLASQEKKEIELALNFFKTLDHYGHSKLAAMVIEKYSRGGSSSFQKDESLTR